MLLRRVDHRASGLVRVVQARAAVVASCASPMSYYDDVQSMLLRRGERLFPFSCFDQPRDWEKIGRMMDHLVTSGERVMTPDEILELYD